MALKRTVTRSTRASSRKKKSTKLPKATSMQPSKDISDELSMGSAPSFRVKKGPIIEHNGLTRQRARSMAPKKRYRIKTYDLANMICPLYKLRWEGYGFNYALVNTTNLNNDTITYDTASGISTYGNNALGSPKGTWKSCEWNSGQQYWFESPALMFYKKFPDGTRRSVTELIQKYPDIVKHTAFNTDVNISDFYGAIQTYVDTSGVIKNKLADGVNICYHGGKQVHTFTNFGVTEVEMEFWELHPRVNLSGYIRTGSTGTSPNLAAVYRPDYVWKDLIRDHIDNTPFGNTKPIVDDYKSIDEVTDVGVRIDADCRTIHYKYKVSNPVRTRIAPGGTFTYEMQLPAFKVTGGEFLEYLVRHQNVEDSTTVDNSSLREEMRPSFIPKFTRILCGRMFGQKTVKFGTEGTKPDGNTGDTKFISKHGFGPGIVGHIMSEYHELNVMPVHKATCYQRMSFLDTDGDMNTFIDGGDDDEVTANVGTGNDTMSTNNALTINLSK